MRIFDLIAMCIRNLTRRKFRTFLTVTGVVIGATSIIIMISLGVGIRQAQDDMFNSFGDLSIINVYNWGGNAGTSENPLDDQMVENFQNIPGVLIATPFVNFRMDETSATLFAGRKNRYQSWNSLTGVKLEALPILGYTIDEGVMLGQTETPKQYQMICGKQFAYSFMDTKKRGANSSIDFWTMDGSDPPPPFFDPLEQKEYQFILQSWTSEDTKPTPFDMTMVGIIFAEEYEWEKQQGCFVDIEDLKEIKKIYEKENKIKPVRGKVEQYETVKVKVEDVSMVSEVQAQIEGLGFMCDSMQQYRDQMQESTQQIQLILAILGGVSLFVASISITNTMIMSVYERTREIGVMKVLGCLVGNIRTIFLMEAGLIGLFGGIIGVGFSYLLSYLFNTFGSSFASGMGVMNAEGAKLSIIPLWLVLTGMGVATLIGLLAGFYPANRAVRISALEAIKQE